MSCEETRALAVELALGIADGEARARALEHIAACRDCRREVELHAATAASLLSLAPSHAPPPGFEARVLERIARERAQAEAGAAGRAPEAAARAGAEPAAPAPAPAPPPRRRGWRTPRWRPVVATLLLVLVAAGAAAGGAVVAFHGDRQVADHYRATLAEAGGSYFTAGRLTDATGARVGAAFAYAGRPSWVFVTLGAGQRDVARHVELTTADGRVVVPPAPQVAAGATSWGGVVPLAVRELTGVRLVAPGGAQTLTARLR